MDIQWKDVLYDCFKLIKSRVDFWKEMWLFVGFFQLPKRASWPLKPLAQNLVFKKDVAASPLVTELLIQKLYLRQNG